MHATNNLHKLSFFKKAFVCVLIFVLMLSMIVPMIVIPSVSAASSVLTSGKTYYIDISQYTGMAAGSNEKLTVECYNASGNVISSEDITLYKDNVYKFTASNGTAVARLLKKNTTMPDATAAIASGKRRVFYENNNGWSTVYAYAWRNTNEPLGAWHGTQMTRIGSTKYWYIDLDTTCSDIIFNDGSSNKTGDLSIPSDVQKPLFVNGNSWVSYGIINRIDMRADSRPSDDSDTFYVLNASDGSWSKYPQTYSTSTVYVYAPSWSSAYASFDPNDPLTKVVKGSNVTKDGSSSATTTGFFKVEVPVGSTFTFRPNSDNTAASTANLTKPSSLSVPCYVISKSTWLEMSAVNITSAVDYSVGHNFGDDVLAVKATYYDYLSDAEITNGWLNPTISGTGHSGSNDDWYPFKKFNTELSNYYSNNNITNALYFGNFCNTDGAYPNGNDHNITTSWSSYTGSLHSFNYYKNNSNGLPNSNTSYQGLVDSTLSNGKLTTNGKAVPFFDETFLISGSTRYGYVIDSFFPFRADDKGSYTEYSFTSVNASDNVYFNWYNGKPSAARYSSDAERGVDDGLKYFMYNTASGKGIFPFNFASGHVPDSSTGYTGNNNLDYGFGIKMEIDFRVPKGGVIPGTNTPIKFSFSGDDDLWVYITDNETNTSQLVLDLGGSHKESTGEINFATKTSTANNVFSESEPTGTRYVYLTKDNVGWSNDSTYAYFYNDSGDAGNSWPGYKMSTYSDGNNLRVAIPANAKYVIFHNNAGSQTAGSKAQTVSYGAYWLSSDKTVNQWSSKPSDAGTEPIITAGSKQKSFTFDNSDDQKTYTMTVFYVERGLIESNMKINFTMTPLSNDLTVDKVVNVDSINSGLKRAVLNDDTFKFTVKDGGAAASSTAYTYITAAETKTAATNSSGALNLKNGEQARFDSAFDNGSSITVSETANSNGGLKYSTKWSLYDGNDGTLMNEGSNLTSSFTMTNSSDDPNKRASLYLNYENTALAAPIEVHKDVVASADVNPNTEFTFDIGIDLAGNGTYSKYNLEYELYNGATKVGTFTAENGRFSITSSQYVKFLGIPQGANYRIVENVRNGYALQGISGADTSNVSSRTATGTVGTANSVTFTNEFNPGDAVIELWKSLDGSATDGTASEIPEFSFKLEGLSSVTLSGGKQTVDTSSIAPIEVKNSQNGKIVFQNTATAAPFTYGDVGIYRYKISEINGGNVLYTYDATVYYAEINVTADAGGALVVAAPLFYTNAEFTEAASKPVFNNITNHGYIEISKLGEYTADDGSSSTEYLEGVEFTVFTDETCTSVAKNSNGDDMKGVTSKVATEDRASVSFTNVPLGIYYAAETKSVTSTVTGVDYELYGKVIKIEVNSSTETLYDGVSRDYAVITDREGLHIPITGGTGIALLLTVGFGIIAISVFYLSKNSKIKAKVFAKTSHNDRY